MECQIERGLNQEGTHENASLLHFWCGNPCRSGSEAAVKTLSVAV